MTAKEKALRDRLLSLMSSWSRINQKIQRKKARVITLDKHTDTNPTIFGKLKKLIDQIVFFSEKERDIISKIEAVEQKHRMLRKQKQLKKARPLEIFPDTQLELRKDKTRNLWWLFLLFVIIYRRRQQNSKKYALKAG